MTPPLDFRIETALYSALEAAVVNVAPQLATGVHRHKAPAGSQYPLVVFQQVSAPDSYTFAKRAFTDYTYQVKAIAAEDDGVDAQLAAETLAAAIDAALNLQTLDFPEHDRTWRLDRLPMPEEDEGRSFEVIVQNYEIRVVM